MLAPAQMEAEAPDAVERVLLMGSKQYLYCLLVPFRENRCWLVVAAAGDAELGNKVLLPSRLDFLQDG